MKCVRRLLLRQRPCVRRAMQVALLLFVLWLGYTLFRNSRFNTMHIGGATLRFSNHLLSVSREDGKEVLTARVGLNYDLAGPKQVCSTVTTSSDRKCVEWKEGIHLKMSVSEDHHVTCYHVQWETFPTEGSPCPMDCFQVGNAHWYGMGEVRSDHWTLEKQMVKMQPFLPADIIDDPEVFGSVLERYWLSSEGVGVYVDDSVPLHVGVNGNQICLKAQYADSAYQWSNSHRQTLVLDYQICVGANVKAVHEYMSAKHWDRPQGHPDERMLKYPIWSTRARYKTNIDQEHVELFAQEITKHGFLGSQLEIDDMYTPVYGDFMFDKRKFPDPLKMSKKLHNLGFKMTAWIIPFHNTDSQAFMDGLEYNYFVQTATKDVPALTVWWQGTAALLDITRESAVKWFGHRLQTLRDEGVDGFKFDAGEVSWLPAGCRTHTKLPHVHHYTTQYAEAMYQLSDNTAEVRAAYRNQRLPIFVRMMDRLSRWDHDLGLKTLIPTALTLGIIGYPFVLPDMIGGNAYSQTGNTYETVLPEKELFIRWLQITAFMPAMQFSIAPWQYDLDTVAIAKKYVKLHETYVFPRVVKLARQSMVTGEPIVRPLWWADPEDEATYGIADQFMVGNDLLVAPITYKGAISRKLYLPKGRWRRPVSGKGVETVYKGGEWIWDYPVELEDVAYFERISD